MSRAKLNIDSLVEWKQCNDMKEALLDILDLSKGEPRMSGASTFSANSHRMGRIHNRARQAFGEGPLRISGVLEEDE